MENKSIEVWLRNKIARFAVARDGNVAIIFGIAAMPLLLAVGATVDFSRGSATKTSMQAALDSAALNLVNGINPSDDLKPKATALFNAVFSDPAASNIGSMRRMIPRRPYSR